MRKHAGNLKWDTPHDTSFEEEVLYYLQEVFIGTIFV
jgi:hypothetical protein